MKNREFKSDFICERQGRKRAFILIISSPLLLFYLCMLEYVFNTIIIELHDSCNHLLKRDRR